ncbi:MAG: MATE family efflux transporter, partial [Myxococcota bacterium]
MEQLVRLPVFTLNRARLEQILTLAVPIILGMASQNVLNLIDTAFVGQLGDAALAAVGMGGFANWLLAAFLIGLGAGVQATAARRLGEQKEDETAVGLNAALVITLVVGIPAAFVGEALATDLFALLNNDPEVVRLGGDYLGARLLGLPFVAANFAFRGFWNGTNRPRNYLITLVFMHSINIVLDYGLIFGNLGLPELGAAGAGYATSISLMCGTSMYIALAWTQARGNGFLSPRHLWEVLPVVVRLSVPAGFQQVIFSAGFVVFFVIAGEVGTSALAASNVLINLALVCVLPGIGFGLAGASLVGQALGANERDDASRWGYEITTLAVAVMGTIGLLLALFPRFWLSIFIVDNPETLEMDVVPLIVLGLYQSVD